jgi:hypothetical protein
MHQRISKPTNNFNYFLNFVLKKMMLLACIDGFFREVD